MTSVLRCGSAELSARASWVIVLMSTSSSIVFDLPVTGETSSPILSRLACFYMRKKKHFFKKPGKRFCSNFSEFLSEFMAKMMMWIYLKKMIFLFISFKCFKCFFSADYLMRFWPQCFLETWSFLSMLLWKFKSLIKSEPFRGPSIEDLSWILILKWVSINFQHINT